MKASSRVAIVFTLVVIGLGALLRTTDRWLHEQRKRLLDGPFLGLPLRSLPQTMATGCIKGPEGAVIEVFGPGTNAPPVVLLRLRTGVAAWARLLEPVGMPPEVAGPPVGQIFSVELLRTRTVQSGYDLEVFCRWTRGEHEWGVIRLRKDLSFRDFWLESTALPLPLGRITQ